MRRDDRPSEFKALAGSETSNALSVTLSTAQGRATTYTINHLPDGREQRTTSDAGCACSQSETLKYTDGSSTTTAQDGTLTYQLLGPDPRFGMQAPIVQKATVTTPSGLLSTTTAARAVTLGLASDPTSLLTQTDTLAVNGKTTTSVYTAATKTVSTTSPVGRQSVTTLDAKGRVASEQAGTLIPVAYGYDGRGRLTTVTQATRTSRLSYDAQGNLASITDPLARVTQFTYDLAGRVLTQTLPDGRQIAFGYDVEGNVTSITPPGKPAHAFAYTPVNLQGSYTPPDLGIGPVATSYAYNLDKQLTAITRPDGKSVGFGYDLQGRLATITSPLGATTFSYDPTKGQLSRITTPDGQQLGYTSDGFLETGVSWTGAVNGSITRTYNTDFRVTSTSVNGANPVSYAYDADGLLTNAGGLVIARDATNGLITGTTIGAVTDSRGYNAYGELLSAITNVSGTVGLADTYTRDQLGRVVQKQETIGGTTDTYAYTYDAAGRLTQVTKTPQAGAPITTTYTYDSNGNRLSKTDPSGSITGTYDAQDRLTQYGTTTYAYNANGDLTSKTQNAATVSYEYDVFGNLRHVALDSGVTIDYVIDARNRRIGKKVNGTLVQGFLYDDQLRPAAELDGAGNVVSRFVYGAHVNVPELIIKGGVTYRIVHDHLGSPRLVVNTADGSIAQRMDFDEFGTVTLDTNPGFQPFGFAGGLFDTQTKLVRFGARDYDAQVGRWTARDPLGFGGDDANLYAYLGSDPVGGADPLGLFHVKEHFAVVPDSLTGGGQFGPQSPYFTIDGKPHCTQSGNGWSFQYDIDIFGLIHIPPTGCSKAKMRHEKGHEDVFRANAYEFARQFLTPYEDRVYDSKESCEAGFYAGRKNAMGHFGSFDWNAGQMAVGQNPIDIGWHFVDWLLGRH